MITAASILANVKVLWPGGLNTSYYLDVNNFARHTAWLHGFMHAYALWLGLTLMTLVFLAAYTVVWWRRDVHAAALMGLGGAGTLIALGLNQLVGHAAEEVRPYDTYTHALVLVGKAHDYAFPSDHAVVAGALSVAVLLIIRRAAPQQWWRGSFGNAADRRERAVTGAMAALAIVSVVLGLLLSFSRVYVGAHYPGDVVAGLLLGAVVVLLVSAVRPIAYRIADIVEPSPLGIFIRRPPGAGRTEMGMDKEHLPADV